ncbi:MAG TPA: hypothetical protein VJB57_07095, partial [Dehalococcoidia bacterium]|nr:hypothetical protein [Dehalococcoidia bacterium]
MVTGAEPYRASTMSVYVQSPVDSPPHNQFQLAIYEDHRGAPRRLVARSEPGILVPNSWNTLPIVADLQAEAAYWLMYNSNASRNPVNRLAFAPSQLDSLDSVIRYHRLEGLERIAHGLEVVGDFSLMTAAVVVLCVWAGRKRPLTGVVFFSAFLAGQVLVLVSKEVLFAPYGDYPSGHVMRLVFAVLLLAFILPHRVVYVGGAVLV